MWVHIAVKLTAGGQVSGHLCGLLLLMTGSIMRILFPLQIAFAKLAVQQTLYSDFMHHRWNASSVGSFSVRLTLSMTSEGFSTAVSRDCRLGP